MSEMTESLGSTKNKIIKQVKNGQNVPRLEVIEVVLFQVC